jgi:trimeric autotransporter adhesin
MFTKLKVVILGTLASLRTVVSLSLILSFLMVTNVAYGYVASWGAPGGAPSPSNNAYPPLNTGSTAQVKNGALGVDSLAVYNDLAVTSNTTVGGTLSAGGEISSTMSSGYGQFRMVNGNYGAFWRNDGSNTYFLLTNSGDQYGQWNGLRPLYINDANGNVTVGTSLSSPAFYYTSDERLKHDIQTIPNALSSVTQLRGVSFKWNSDNRSDVGLIAQEVEKVFPEAVHTDPTTGIKSVEYANLVGPLVEAVKEQQQEIQTLQQQVKELQQK